MHVYNEKAYTSWHPCVRWLAQLWELFLSDGETACGVVISKEYTPVNRYIVQDDSNQWDTESAVNDQCMADTQYRIVVAFSDNKAGHMTPVIDVKEDVYARTTVGEKISLRYSISRSTGIVFVSIA